MQGDSLLACTILSVVSKGVASFSSYYNGERDCGKKMMLREVVKGRGEEKRTTIY